MILKLLTTKLVVCKLFFNNCYRREIPELCCERWCEAIIYEGLASRNVTYNELNHFSVNNGVREGVWFEVLMFATMDPRTEPCGSINRPRGTIDVHSGTTWHSPSCLHTLHSYVLTVCLNRPKKAATMYEFNASSSDARLRCEESPLVSSPQDGSSSYPKLHLRHHRVQELSTPAEPPVSPFQVTRGLQHPQQFSHFVVSVLKPSGIRSWWGGRG